MASPRARSHRVRGRHFDFLGLPAVTIGSSTSTPWASISSTGASRARGVAARADGHAGALERGAHVHACSDRRTCANAARPSPSTCSIPRERRTTSTGWRYSPGEVRSPCARGASATPATAPWHTASPPTTWRSASSTERPVTFGECHELIRTATGKMPNTMRMSLGIVSDFGDAWRFMRFVAGLWDRPAEGL